MRKLSRRDLLKMVGGMSVGAAALSLLGACGGGAAPAPAPTTAPAAKKEEAKPAETPVAQAVAPTATPAPAAKEPVTLRWHGCQGVHSVWIEKRTKEFTAEVPNIRVKIEPTASGHFEHFAKLKAMHAAHQIGDLIYTCQCFGFHQDLSSKGITRDIDELIAADKYDLTQHFPAQVEGAKLNGKMYALPENIHLGGSGLMFNQTIFDQAGVAYPTMDWTWDDLIAACRKVTKDKNGDGKVDQWSLSLTLWPESLESVLRSFGGHIIAPDGKTCTLDKPEVVAALTMYQDLIHKHKVSPTQADIQEDEYKMFVAGAVAMLETDAWSLSDIVNITQGKFYPGAVLKPKGPSGKHGTNTGGDFATLTAQSKYPDETFQVAKFLCNKESGVRKVLEGAWAPGARPDVWTDKRLLDRHPAYKLWAEALATSEGQIHPWNFRGAEVFDTVQNELRSILLGKVTPEDGAKGAQRAVQKVLDMPPAV